jgi:hypothetical protein
MLRPLLAITTLRYTQVTNQQVVDRISDIGMTEYVKELLADHDYSELTPRQVSLNPWLYDPALPPGEMMYWKLKGVCHECRISVSHHRDDCCFSSNQLMFAQMERFDYGLEHINKYINTLIGPDR